MNDKEFELEKLKLNVEVWKKIVDVQQHFNDLEMKVRNFGILIISAFISAVGVSLKSNYEVNIFTLSLPVGSLIALVALFVWNLVFFVDVYWYHPLLKGAVVKGIAIENEIKKQLPEINLTETIGEASSIKFLWWKELHSTSKAKIFYNGVSIALLAIAISLIFFSNNKKPSSEPVKIESEFSKVDTRLSELIKQSEILRNSISKLEKNQLKYYCRNICSTESLQTKFKIFKKEVDEHLDRHLDLIKKMVIE